MSESIAELQACVEGVHGLRWIRGGGVARAWNNILYKAGMSSKDVGSKALSMNVATISPGGVAYAHIHVDFELMLYILQGRVRYEYGEGLAHSVVNEAVGLSFISPWRSTTVLHIA